MTQSKSEARRVAAQQEADDPQEPAPEGVEQILAVHTDVVKGWVGSDSDPESPKLEVVVVSLHFRARTADATDEPLQTLVVFPAEDARTLRHQLAVADETKTVAEQVSE